AADDRKRAVRAEMLEQRAMLAREEAAGRSATAQRHVLASSHWTSARTVMLYMPIRGEMDTGLLRSQAWAEGKRVLLPRCVAGRPGELDLVACERAADIAPGAYGIPEPLPSLPTIDLEDPQQVPQLLIAPCLAVDRRGYRLGYGGGYYDRLLRHPALRMTLCLGLIYAVQLVAALPVESWDARLHGICTEQGFLWG
ncbi:MAG: 5-formyltetrahydrofolate cyclo-ligase, partial [Desulfovibrionaceae bacterium]|nr:5-formyltetrahydrofolate cyclo-ligase [Desulfovibrionaceae bacterium]